METENIDFERLEGLIKKYPMGSKILCKGLQDSVDKVLPCKVIGYSTWTYRVLVYNPEINGNNGNRWCVDGDGNSIRKEDTLRKYKKNCAFVSDGDTNFAVIVGGTDEY